MAARAAQGRNLGRGRQFWTVESLTSPDFLLSAATIVLSVFGLVMVFSASSIESVEIGLDPWSKMLSQGMYLVFSVVMCLIVRHFGGKPWLDMWFYPLWGAVVVLLVAVFLFGDESHGATRWISIGPFSLQPSEFAKIAIIMATARTLAKWESGQVQGKIFIAQLVVFIGVPLFMILFQKDLGTLLIVGASVYLMGILVKAPNRFMVGAALAVVGGVIFLIYSSGYRSARIGIWLDPFSDYYGDGWQPVHGLYAIASGGFFGLGLGQSRQKYSYLPEAENDYIFAIIAEELGFLGAFVVIALFVLWGVNGMRIAYRARERDRAASLMAYGLTFIIVVQVLLNIGGVLGVLPLSGRPLPFISAGGSSILSTMLIVGLLLGVARDNDVYEFTRATSDRGSASRSNRSNFTVLDGGQQPYTQPRQETRPYQRERSTREPAGGRGAAPAYPRDPNDYLPTDYVAPNRARSGGRANYDDGRGRR